MFNGQQIPDLTGYRLQSAEDLLKEMQVDYVLKETSPPRRDVGGDEKRVVRCLFRNGQAELIWCNYSWN